MKFQRLVITILVLFFVIMTYSPVLSQSYSYGRLRALNDRAITVIQMKNRFITRVLDTYDVPYESNAEGVIVRIKVENVWNDVDRIDIVPLMSNDGEGVHVIAHNIFFGTKRGIFHLVSQLAVR